MPEHGSWFDVLLGTFYLNMQHAAGAFGFNESHSTWIGHAPIRLQHVVGYAFVVVLLGILAFRVNRQIADVKAALIPEDRLTLRTFFELLVGAVYKMMSDMMGPKAAKFFLPLIGTCAFVILFSNVLGLIPGFIPPTDNLNTTLAMGLVIFITTHIFGLKEHGPRYLKHFLGPFLPLAPLMLIIELISHIVRPLTLAIRLMANMTADHMVLGVFISLTFVIVPIPMYVMGCIVVTVQTLVFCMLSSIYISLAIAHEDH